MAAPTEARIRAEINTIGDPCSAAHGMPLGMTDMGLVEAVRVAPGGEVDVRLRLTSPCCGMVGYFVDEITRRVSSLDGVGAVAVSVDHGLDWTPAMMSEEARRARRARLTSLGIPATPASVS